MIKYCLEKRALFALVSAKISWLKQGGVNFKRAALFVMCTLFISNTSLADEGLKTLVKQAEQFQQGWDAAQKGDLNKANKIWQALNQETIEVPELSRALQNNLAVLLIKQQAYKQAEELLDSALKADIQVATTLSNLNQLYAYQAQKAYKKVFSQTSVTSPTGELLYFDVKNSALPTEYVSIKLPEFSPEEAFLYQPETQEILTVKNRLDQWRAAWANQDIQSYLNFYHSKEFVPKDGMRYSVWEESRHRSLKRPKFIKIGFDDVQVVQLDKNLVRTRFLQKYESNSFKDSVYKVVLWQLDGTQWKIVQEVVASEKS
jgi:tetratricopeptide (TPR) repeat protein